VCVCVEKRLPSVCRLPQPQDSVGSARVAVRSLGLDPDDAPLLPLRLQMDRLKVLLRRGAALIALVDAELLLDRRAASWTARLTDFNMTSVLLRGADR